MPEEFNMEEFSRRLRHLRMETLNMPTKPFAEKAGVSPGTINHYENQKCSPSASVVFNICKAYNVSADWLLGLKEESTCQ